MQSPPRYCISRHRHLNCLQNRRRQEQQSDQFALLASVRFVQRVFQVQGCGANDSSALGRHGNVSRVWSDQSDSDPGAHYGCSASGSGRCHRWEPVGHLLLRQCRGSYVVQSGRWHHVRRRRCRYSRGPGPGLMSAGLQSTSGRLGRWRPPPVQRLRQGEETVQDVIDQQVVFLLKAGVGDPRHAGELFVGVRQFCIESQ